MNEIFETELYHLVEGRHGKFLANPNDRYLGRSIIKYGEFSEVEWRALDQLIKPGAIVVEAGANMGAFTVPIAKKVGRQGLVYAFEPQLMVFQQLCANLALNDLVNVQAFNAGCGDTQEWIQIVRPNPAVVENYGGFSLNALKGESMVKVRIEKLDDTIDPPRLNLIKADVEGMEPQVLRGASGLIARFRPVLYVEAHNPDESPVLIRLLQEMEYDLWWHLPLMYSADNYTGDPENIFGNITSKNILGVPKEHKLNIRAARPVAGENDHPRHWVS